MVTDQDVEHKQVTTVHITFDLGLAGVQVAMKIKLFIVTVNKTTRLEIHKSYLVILPGWVPQRFASCKRWGNGSAGVTDSCSVEWRRVLMSSQRGVHGHRTLLRAVCAERPAGVGVGDG